MTKSLTRLLARHHEVIVNGWVSQVRVADDTSFATRPTDDVHDLCQSFFRAFLSAIGEGSVAGIRSNVNEVGPRLAAHGFRLAEVQHAILLFREVVCPFLANAYRDEVDAFLNASRAVDTCVNTAVFEFSETYLAFVDANARAYVHELEVRNRALEHMVVRDGLTGLYNHKYFHERLHEELRRARRYQRTLTLLLIDVDQFKQVNDTLGHPAGDRVLLAVAQEIRGSIRETDVPARCGGDEFAVLLPEATSEGGRIVAERIRGDVRRVSARLGLPTPGISLSVGVAAFPDDASDADELFDHADQALYEAKRNGRNQVATAAKNAGYRAGPASEPATPSRWVRLAS